MGSGGVAIAALPTVICLKVPFSDGLGGYSQVMYQIELLRLSLNNECCFDRFVLITGQDYPLVPNEIMIKAYEETPNRQYIKGLDKTLYHRKGHHEFTLYHFFRDTKFRNPKVKQLFSFGFRLLFLLLPVRKKPYVICNNQKWHIWQSSSYMSLTRDCAKFVLSEMQNNRTLIRYFKYSFVPEEKMIPTIIFNSKYKKYAMVSEFREYRGLIYLSALEEFCYGKEIKVYQEEDYDHLVTSNKFFCRKVETGKSDKLMELLDKHNGYYYRE